MTSRYSIAFLISLAFLTVADYGQVAFSSKEDVAETVNSVPCDQKLRLDGVKKMFKMLGASEGDITIEEYEKGKIRNLVVRKAGTSDETIVIGAHYDKTPDGCGALDNWTGISVIGHIYRTLKPLTTIKSYVFVAFDQEEEGLRGSAQMAKAMKAEGIAKTCSMVNFDSFGQAYPMALRHVASTKMLKLAEALGNESGFKFQTVEIPGAGADSTSFIEKKIPSITLSGLAGNWAQVLHTPNDKASNIKQDSVYLGYRFGLQLLAKLDQAGCNEYR
jgi:Zn-dependent M28 family amino/carboxypeptidase